ncbi:MAG: PSD1 and planctomycete cytochrome C domain-containing protein [Pirellulales bacterium]|nr:PSD1 and planctomycete cytochrome C domain-containing protein [Pirellulales bacterium]
MPRTRVEVVSRPGLGATAGLPSSATLDPALLDELAVAPGAAHEFKVWKRISLFVAILLLVAVSALRAPGAEANAPVAEAVDFTREIRPILAGHCFKCHGPDKQESGLRLDTAQGLQTGGYSGPAVAAGKSAESLLIKALTGADDASAMPPEGEKPLAADEIAIVTRWIDEGAKLPALATATGGDAKPAAHWSFQPIRRPALPAVKNSSAVRNLIDVFVVARLEAAGIAPSPEADRVTQLRRLKLDLLGLPPTPAEVDEFLADRGPDAYERLVDRLLASPHYGERWGRHWLDQARYADSNGYTIDGPRPIWKYRDWVIDAVNRDLPFDRFITEQLAGDLLPDATDSQRVATGFHRNTLKNEEGGTDDEQFRVEAVVDRVGTTGEVFLGLTIGCARCHDHKFDPISQRDFYQLFAFYNSCDEPTLELPTPEEAAREAELQSQIAQLESQLGDHDREFLALQEKWEKSLSPEDKDKLPDEIRTLLTLALDKRDARQSRTLQTFYRGTDPARSELVKQIEALEKQMPRPATTLVVAERREPRETHVMLRGDFLRRGVAISPGVPAVLPQLEAASATAAGARLTRLDLARWLVDPRNPLTSRVAVNRVWQRYFGRGLVDTDNDFGTQGTAPTHPELLDWLAGEFVARGWSLKALHRLIVTSATYRRSSHARPDLVDIDPENKLLARQNRVRLEAENIRDVMLAASGLLTDKIGGPSVFPPQPPGVMELAQIKRDWKPSEGADRYRRGMYTYFWRSTPHPLLKLFDAPDANAACTRRNRSNTPVQALTLLNDEAFYECAQALAARVLKEVPRPNGTGSEQVAAGSSATNGGEVPVPLAADLVAARVRQMFLLCLAREPSEIEARRLADLYRAELADGADSATALLDKPAVAPDSPLSPGGRGVGSEGVVETTDASPKAPDGSPTDLAAWTSVARVLLNLDETITRE